MKTLLSALITIGITVTLMFYSLFSPEGRNEIFLYLFFFFFTLWSGRAAKSTRWPDFFLLHISSNISFAIEVWVTASLLSSPGLFSVFWPISVMLWSGSSRFFLWFSVFPKSLVTVSSAPTTFSITVNLVFHSFFLCYFTLYEFFTPALAGGLSQETEWQQVSSSFQESSEHSGWS